MPAKHISQDGLHYLEEHPQATKGKKIALRITLVITGLITCYLIFFSQ